MSIRGYKSFNSDGTNIAGQVFTPGIVYHCDGDIKFGPDGNGFHFAQNMEDTIRYSDCDHLLRNIIIAEVIGSGIIQEGYDDYNGYYNLYASSQLEVLRYLSREDIIALALQLSENRMIRFVSLFQLHPLELPLFENKSYWVDRAIEYYQKGNIDAYTKHFTK